VAGHESKKVIYAALIGNSLIALTKFAASGWTGSSAMLSEAIHSLVDTGNQGLLLYGLRRSKRPADLRHPFGYGMELYFWSFVVAILIFAVGAGISLYEGVLKVLEPHPIKDAYVNYLVLSVAIFFEAGAWWIAFKEFRKTKGALGYLAAVRASKDPAVFTVLFEDSAAMLGLLFALIGIALSQVLEMPIFDGLASIAIGLVLAGVAMLLAYECKGLLIGEAASETLLRGARRLIEAEPQVRGINELRSMHLGPRDVLLAVSVDFDDRVAAGEVEETLFRIERRLKQQYADIRRVFIEIQGAARHRQLAGRPVSGP
jgi:cation diffusion facilitator family transporter